MINNRIRVAQGVAYLVYRLGNKRGFIVNQCTKDSLKKSSVLEGVAIFPRGVDLGGYRGPYLLPSFITESSVRDFVEKKDGQYFPLHESQRGNAPTQI